MQWMTMWMWSTVGMLVHSTLMETVLGSKTYQYHSQIQIDDSYLNISKVRFARKVLAKTHTAEKFFGLTRFRAVAKNNKKKIRVAVMVPASGNYPFTFEKVKMVLNRAYKNIQAIKFLPKYELEFVHIDTKCKRLAENKQLMLDVMKVMNDVLLARACPEEEKYTKQRMHLILGPVCSGTAVDVMHLNAANAQLPIITPGAPIEKLTHRYQEGSRQYESLGYHKIITRTYLNYAAMTQTLYEIFTQQRWRKLVMLWDSRSNEQVIRDNPKVSLTDDMACKHLMASIFEMGPKYNITDIANEGMTKDDWKEVGNILKQYGRPKMSKGMRGYSVFLLCADLDTVNHVMMKAADLGFAKGEYVFIHMDVFGSLHKRKPWKIYYPEPGNQQRAALVAYNVMLSIALKTPENKIYNNLVQYLEQGKDSNSLWNILAAFYDSLFLYAYGVDSLITNQKKDPQSIPSESSLLDESEKITKIIWSHPKADLVTGEVFFHNGDRSPGYVLLDMNDRGEFQIVADYGQKFGKSTKTNKTINWGNEDTGETPKDTPEKGYNYDNRRHTVFESKDMLYLIMAMIVVLIICIIISIVMNKHVKQNTTQWRVYWHDIKKVRDPLPRDMNASNNEEEYFWSNQYNFNANPFQWRKDNTAVVNVQKPKQKQKQNLRSSIEHSDASDAMSTYSTIDRFHNIYVMTGNYRSVTVAIKNCQLHKKFDPKNERFIKKVVKLKDLRHDNVAPLIGVCIDFPNKCIITEYCTKGSLEDVLANKNINLDSMFKYSLLIDIVEGMIFLHANVGPHGNLKITNCIVDARFAVKVTDFGLHLIRGAPSSKVPKNPSRRRKWYRNRLWTAPEILRNSNSLPDGSTAGDIYSFAIIAQEIIYQSGTWFLGENVPKISPEEIVIKVSNKVIGKRPPFRPYLREQTGLSVDLLNIIKMCWDEQPLSRPSFHHIKVVMRKFIKIRGNIFDNLLKRMEQYSSNLEAIVAERTKAYEKEKEKAENLLYCMLPKSVAKLLMKNQTVPAEHFQSVSIYFSDIVGFTKLSCESTPIQVVRMLNDLYTLFDSIVGNFDVYKVETIGDAYMVASGVPMKNGNLHAPEIAKMSLAFLTHIKKFRIAHKPDHKMMMRIGIHSGPVCAGVIGLKMPRFCLFGDTVNTASRLETNGLPNKIHIGFATKEILDNHGTFIISERGEIHMKGKGRQRTYWLHGMKPKTMFPRSRANLAGETSMAHSVAPIVRKPVAAAEPQPRRSTASQGDSTKPQVKPAANSGNLRKALGFLKTNIADRSQKMPERNPVSRVQEI